MQINQTKCFFELVYRRHIYALFERLLFIGPSRTAKIGGCWIVNQVPKFKTSNPTWRTKMICSSPCFFLKKSETLFLTIFLLSLSEYSLLLEVRRRVDEARSLCQSNVKGLCLKVWLNQVTYIIFFRSFQDGYKEGFDNGKRKGIHKGWELGVEKGGEIGTEVWLCDVNCSADKYSIVYPSYKKVVISQKSIRFILFIFHAPPNLIGTCSIYPFTVFVKFLSRPISKTLLLPVKECFRICISIPSLELICGKMVKILGIISVLAHTNLCMQFRIEV